MKRIISILTVVMLVVSMFSITAMAADPKTMTIALSTDKANVGDEFTVNAVLASTVDVKDMQVYIEYDPADFELGTSDAADELVQGFYDEYIGEGKDYATMEDFLVDMGYASVEACIKDSLGVASYVDTTYYDAYSALDGKYKWGTPAIGAEVRDGMMNVMFSYMKDTKISKLNNKTNLSVGGAVLKVATAEQKQSVISVKKSFTTYDTSGTKLYVVSEDVVVNLNGYGEVVEPEDPYDLETNYVAAVEDKEVTSQYGTYKVNTALIFGSSINTGSAETFGTEIYPKGYEGTPIDIVASKAAQYDAGLEKTGYMAAMTSIRPANLDRTFVARAYAIDENKEKVYGAEKEAVFSEVIAE